MLIDTTTLIDETIGQLETLRGLFADDYTVCRRAGLAHDADACGEALAAIAALLPKLERARAVQELTAGAAPRVCLHCD